MSKKESTLNVDANKDMKDNSININDSKDNQDNSNQDQTK